MLLCFLLLMADAHADTVWVLCQPDSYVNIRATANKHGKEAGYALCGDSFETDGKVRNGYLHVLAPNELGEGWIAEGYIVWNEPKEVNAEYTIRSNGRVSIRKTIDGKRRKWGHDSDVLTVYWMTSEWALTNQGFIRTEYLEAPNDL